MKAFRRGGSFGQKKRIATQNRRTCTAVLVSFGAVASAYLRPSPPEIFVTRNVFRFQFAMANCRSPETNATVSRR